MAKDNRDGTIIILDDSGIVSNDTLESYQTLYGDYFTLAYVIVDGYSKDMLYSDNLDSYIN